MHPSGQQWELSWGEQRATVVEVGGGIRAYHHGQRPVLEPYAVTEVCDGGHGAPLIPWPNRLADGRYDFAGRRHQLDLSEPARGNAMHGLLRWRNWSLLGAEAARVRVGIRLHPQSGWPFALDARIEYRLGAEGLSVCTEVENIGQSDAPLAVGQHPYLCPGAARVDAARLKLEAATRIRVDDAHAVPVGTEPVRGGDFDFGSSRLIGGQQIDDAFTGLQRDPGGRAWVRLTGADEHTVELWVDGAYRVIQLFTGDTLAPERRRTGLAVEPMSAPANALQSGDDLVVLAPGRTWTGTWGVRLAAPQSAPEVRPVADDKGR